MDAAVMDLSQAFEYGQGYVALSRVRRLKGLFLVGINKRALEVHPEIFEKDSVFREQSEAAEASFHSMDEKELGTLHANFIRACGGTETIKPVTNKEKAKKTKSGKEPSAAYAAKLATAREKYPRAYTPWTKEDDELLVEAFHKDEDQQRLSKKFGRQPGSIQARLVKLGLIEDEYRKGEEE